MKEKKIRLIGDLSLKIDLNEDEKLIIRPIPSPFFNRTSHLIIKKEKIKTTDKSKND